MTEVDNKGEVSMDITNKVTSIVEDVTNPSNETENLDMFNEDSKKTEFKQQAFGENIKERANNFWNDFSFWGEVVPGGTIKKEIFDKISTKDNKIEAEKFRLMKLIDKLRFALEKNQKGKNPISLDIINDVLSDPTVKIKELENEIQNHEHHLEELDREEKRFAAGIVLKKIRDAEERIKELKEDHVNRATMKDLDSDPELQKIIKQVRNKIDSLSKKLKDVVDEKLGITIDKNMGIYLNRQYRIHNDPAYRKKMLEVIKAMQGRYGEKKTKKILERYKKEVQIIREAMVEVRKRLVEKHGDNFLENTVLDDIETMFRYKLEDSDYYKQVNRLNDVDTKIFRKRKDIPEAIAELYSEVENPIFNIVKTLTNMTVELETLRFKSDVISNLEGSLVFREGQVPEGLRNTTHRHKITLKFARNKDGSNIVWYTTKEIKDFFEGENFDSNPLYKIVLAANSLWKLGKTVYSIKTHMRNFLGNIYFSSMNGHFSMSNFAESWKVMQNLFDKSTTEEREILFATMIEKGIIDSVYADELKDILKDGSMTWFATEMFEAGEDMDSIKKKKPHLFKKFNKWVNRMYLWEDVVWKGAGFISEVKLYQDAGYSRDEAVDLAAESIRSGYTTYALVPKLGKRLRRVPIVGDFVSFPLEVVRTGLNSLDMAKKQILSGNPVLMQAGMKRIMGITFAWTSLAKIYMAIASGLATGISSLVRGFGDEEDEDLALNPLFDHKLMNGEERKIDSKFTLYETYSDYYNNTRGRDNFEDINTPNIDRDKMIQLFAPEWMKNGDIKLSRADLNDDGRFNGTYYLWNVSDNMSNNIITNFLNAIFNTPEDDPTYTEKKRGVFRLAMKTLLEPFLGKSMMLQLFENLATREAKSGASLDEANDDWWDRAGNSLMETLDQAQPGAIEQATDILNSWHPERNPFLDEEGVEKMKERKDLETESMALLGFRLSRFNLQENLGFKAKSVVKAISGIDPDDDKWWRSKKRNIRIEKERLVRQLTYLDKLWRYSEVLGINEDHVVVRDNDGEEIKNNLSNRVNVLGKEIRGFKPGNPIYDMLNRDMKNNPTVEEYIKRRGDNWTEFLKDWQKEEIEKQLSE
jgi:hypothetical protein